MRYNNWRQEPGEEGPTPVTTALSRNWKVYESVKKTKLYTLNSERGAKSMHIFQQISTKAAVAVCSRLVYTNIPGAVVANPTTSLSPNLSPQYHTGGVYIWDSGVG